MAWSQTSSAKYKSIEFLFLPCDSPRGVKTWPLAHWLKAMLTEQHKFLPLNLLFQLFYFMSRKYNSLCNDPLCEATFLFMYGQVWIWKIEIIFWWGLWKVDNSKVRDDLNQSLQHIDLSHTKTLKYFSISKTHKTSLFGFWVISWHRLLHDAVKCHIHSLTIQIPVNVNPFNWIFTGTADVQAVVMFESTTSELLLFASHDHSKHCSSR